MRNTAICGKKRENTLRKKCKLKTVKFFVANNIELAVKLNSDGIWETFINSDSTVNQIIINE